MGNLKSRINPKQNDPNTSELVVLKYNKKWLQQKK